MDAVLEAVTRKLGRLCAWRRPTIRDLAKVTEGTSPRRFQLDGRRMRALYGHSLHLVEMGVERPPPPQLFHWTCGRALDVIRQVGLIPVTRRYVHLTSDSDYASRVCSKFSSPVVLTVLSAAAADHRIVFRQANSHVWLSPAIPPEFIREPRGGALDSG